MEAPSHQIHRAQSVKRIRYQSPNNTGHPTKVLCPFPNGPVLGGDLHNIGQVLIMLWLMEFILRVLALSTALTASMAR